MLQPGKQKAICRPTFPKPKKQRSQTSLRSTRNRIVIILEDLIRKSRQMAILNGSRRRTGNILRTLKQRRANDSGSSRIHFELALFHNFLPRRSTLFQRPKQKAQDAAAAAAELSFGKEANPAITGCFKGWRVEFLNPPKLILCILQLWEKFWDENNISGFL